MNLSRLTDLQMLKYYQTCFNVLRIVHLNCKRHNVCIGENKNQMLVGYKAKKFSLSESVALKESQICLDLKFH